jgi:hypothetical protein
MVTPLDLSKLKVYPLAKRTSLTRADDIIVDPDSPAPAISPAVSENLDRCVDALRAAKARGASVMLLYGAHLLRNGAVAILSRLMENGWLTHLATNGAGTIHDWEYAWFGASTESVEMGVSGGTFGTWDETARTTHLALAAGAMGGLGYGRSMGRFIAENGVTVPSVFELLDRIKHHPPDGLTAARADLLQFMLNYETPAGRSEVIHRWPRASILAEAYRHNVPVTVHPGIGYDIVANHPCFNGAILGRAADLDFRLFGGSVEGLDGGVVLSVGSAIMGPQVFEKSISCVNNLRLQTGRPVVSGHSIFVVDIQDGGNWDWTTGEPPKSHPAYYLRFCKSFSRMGGAMRYVQCDNVAFVHNLWKRIS